MPDALEEELNGEGVSLSWSERDNLLIIKMKQGAVNNEIEVSFTISGDIATLNVCVEGCVTAKIKKINLADFKRNLGTVYTTDSKLYGEWSLQGDDYDYLEFDAGSFYGDRYIDVGYGYWYTSGDKLYFVGEECDWDDDTDEYECQLTETVATTYKVTGSGDSRVLEIDDDTWRIFNDDDWGDWDYSPAKAKQSKKPAPNGKDVSASLSKAFVRALRGK